MQKPLRVAISESVRAEPRSSQRATGDKETLAAAHAALGYWRRKRFGNPTPVSGKVFSLRILHGKRPKDASYRYRINIGR